MRTDALLGPDSLTPARRWPRQLFAALAAVIALCVAVPAPALQQGSDPVIPRDIGNDLTPPPPFTSGDFGSGQPDTSVRPGQQQSPAGGFTDGAAPSADGFAFSRLPDVTSPENLAPAIQIVVLLTVLSLAPAILVLCTSFTRIIIVLSLLRQALGAQNLPPNQVLIGLSLFMTCLVMAPTWGRVNSEAIQPYLDGQMTQADAMERGAVPVREFMIAQIEAAGNDNTVLMFQEYARQPSPETWGDVSTLTLIPSFVLSELKVAFLMGFKIYLPFLIVDMVIAAVLISMGMMMLPPVLISLPFKLLLFVLVDGWHLVVGSLMASFAIAG